MRWSTSLFFTSFPKTANHREKTNKLVVFSHRPHPIISKYTHYSLDKQLKGYPSDQDLSS